MKLDFNEYTEAVGESIRHVSEKCYNRIDRAIRHAEYLIHKRNFTEFSNIFNICGEISDISTNDVMGLFAVFSNLFAAVVESHRLVTVNNT